MASATRPILPDPDDFGGTADEAAKLLATNTDLPNAQVTTSNGSNVGGKTVAGAARAGGGAF